MPELRGYGWLQLRSIGAVSQSVSQEGELARLAKQVLVRLGVITDAVPPPADGRRKAVTHKVGDGWVVL